MKIDLPDHAQAEGETDAQFRARVTARLDRTDDKPSIQELKLDAARVAAEESGWTYSRDRLIAAAPVLLEIAATSMALREQEKSAAKLRHALSKMTAPTDEEYAHVDRADAEQIRSMHAYLCALAKVRP